MLSDFVSDWCNSEARGQAAPERTPPPGKKCSEKLHEGNKKTSEKLAQTKNLYYLCIKQKNKRPGYPGND